jgi:hypothetical protein
VKLPGLNLDPAELKPVRFAVCVHVDAGDEPPHRLVMVRGYAVCPNHSLLIDETGSIAGALARLNRAS